MERVAADLATLIRTPLAREHVDRMRAIGRMVDYPAGAAVMEFGRPNDAFFYILSGEAAAFDELTGEQYGLGTLGPTQFMGEMSFLTGGHIVLTTRALTDLSVLRVERADMLQLMAELPEMSDIIVTVLAARRRRLVESDQAGMTLIGAESDRTVRRIASFAARNQIAFRSFEIGSEDAIRVSGRCGRGPAEALVVVGERKVLVDPTPLAVAQLFGLDLSIEEGASFDVVIVGAGPSGIAAGVYAGAEGLRALVVDEFTIGGQAGASSRIENYMGFPTGISGADLCARGEIQALKFGTRFAVPRRITRIERRDDGQFCLTVDDGVSVLTHAVVVATGVQYRRLPLPRIEEFEGDGIYYAATETESRYYRDSEVVVVGGGNSAGQAAMFLSRKTRHVHMLVRGRSLAASMSSYLLDRITRNPAITLHYETELHGLHGEEVLDRVTVLNRRSGHTQDLPAKAVFVMVGALPNTGWLSNLVDLDDKGFVLTGGSSGSEYATSCAGIFAVGDVRAASIKRVAAAVGEGSVVIARVWEHVAQQQLAAGEQQRDGTATR